MSARPQVGVPRSSAPEPRAEPTATATALQGAPAAFAAASAEHARAKRVPASLAAATAPSKSRLSAPGTFLDKSDHRLGIFKPSREASQLRDDRTRRKSAPDPEHSELQSCMDEADPVSGGSAGDPSRAAEQQQPEAAAAAAPQHAPVPGAHTGPPLFPRGASGAHQQRGVPVPGVLSSILTHSSALAAVNPGPGTQGINNAVMGSLGTI